MSRLSPSDVRKLIHEALVVRVRVLLGQTDFDDVLATQERVAHILAAGISHLHPSCAQQGTLPLVQLMFDAFAMDASYYGNSSLEFVISDALVTAGLALADVVHGHESDSAARWQAQVVPELDRIEDFVVSVFDGRWSAHRAALESAGSSNAWVCLSTLVAGGARRKSGSSVLHRSVDASH